MRNLAAPGRLLLAISLMAFGIQYLIYARTGSGLGAPWTPENRLPGCFAGVIFLVSGAAMTIGEKVWLCASAPGVLILLRAFFYYIPRVVATPRNPGPWTSLFELLSILAACFVLAIASIPRRGPSARAGNLVAVVSRFLFAASLIVFGVQHVLYAHFVATLIPAWIPERVFWAWFTAIAFFAASLAIFTNQFASLAGSLLGTMFLIWVFILHAPRVAHARQNGDEWTSLFVALAMSGAAFIIADAPQKRAQTLRQIN